MNKQQKINKAMLDITLKVKANKKSSKETLKVKYGNMKLGTSTLIINMGTAQECPSAKLGMCNAIKKGVKCYALKAEIQYPNAVPQYRQQQFSYWKSNNSTTIVSDLIQKISTLPGRVIKYVRFNESGDFWSQADVDKLSRVAYRLKNFGIVTYGYTARKDLDFKDVHFLVKGSGHKKGNNGMTTIINKDDSIPKGYKECPGDCKICSLCMVDKKYNIAFRKH